MRRVDEVAAVVAPDLVLLAAVVGEDHVVVAVVVEVARGDAEDVPPLRSVLHLAVLLRQPDGLGHVHEAALAVAAVELRGHVLDGGRDRIGPVRDGARPEVEDAVTVVVEERAARDPVDLLVEVAHGAQGEVALAVVQEGVARVAHVRARALRLERAEHGVGRAVAVQVAEHREAVAAVARAVARGVEARGLRRVDEHALLRVLRGRPVHQHEARRLAVERAARRGAVLREDVDPAVAVEVRGDHGAGERLVRVRLREAEVGRRLLEPRGAGRRSARGLADPRRQRGAGPARTTRAPTRATRAAGVGGGRRHGRRRGRVVRAAARGDRERGREGQERGRDDGEPHGASEAAAPARGDGATADGSALRARTAAPSTSRARSARSGSCRRPSPRRARRRRT